MWNEWTSGEADGLSGLGMSWTPEQRRIINLILSIGASRNEPQHVIRAALAAGYVESRFRNLNYGDRDSLGVMQQRPSQGWGTPTQVMDPVYAINKFYDEAHKRMSINDPGRLAQAVQRSGFPSRYGEALPVTDPLLGATTLVGQSQPAPTRGDDDDEAIVSLTTAPDPALVPELGSSTLPLLLVAAAVVGLVALAG